MLVALQQVCPSAHCPWLVMVNSQGQCSSVHSTVHIILAHRSCMLMIEEHTLSKPFTRLRRVRPLSAFYFGRTGLEYGRKTSRPILHAQSNIGVSDDVKSI